MHLLNFQNHPLCQGRYVLERRPLDSRKARHNIGRCTLLGAQASQITAHVVWKHSNASANMLSSVDVSTTERGYFDVAYRLLCRKAKLLACCLESVESTRRCTADRSQGAWVLTSRISSTTRPTSRALHTDATDHFAAAGCSTNAELRCSQCRLQPVQETRDKQSNLWQALILQYCRACRVWHCCRH